MNKLISLSLIPLLLLSLSLPIHSQPLAFVEPFNTLNPAVWKSFGNGTISVSNGILTIINGTNTADRSANITGIISYQNWALGNFIFKVECVSGFTYFGLYKNDDNYIIFSSNPDNSIFINIKNTTHTISERIVLLPPSGFNEYRIKWTLDYVAIYFNNALMANSTIVPKTNLHLLLASNGGSGSNKNGVIHFDYLSVGSWLSEQTTTVTRTITVNSTTTRNYTTSTPVYRTYTTTTYVYTTVNTTAYEYLYRTTVTITDYYYTYAYTLTATTTLLDIYTSYISTINKTTALTASSITTIPITFIFTTYNYTTKWATSLTYLVSTKLLFFNQSITSGTYGSIMAGLAAASIAIGAGSYHYFSTRQRGKITEEKPKEVIAIEGVEKVKRGESEEGRVERSFSEKLRERLRREIEKLEKKFGSGGNNSSPSKSE